MCCSNLYIKVSEQVSAIYIYICQRGICFLLSKVNNQSHVIRNLSHILCRHHHKYKRI